MNFDEIISLIKIISLLVAIICLPVAIICLLVAELQAKRRAGAMLLDLGRVKVWMGFCIAIGSLAVLVVILGLADGFSASFEEWMDIVMKLSIGVFCVLLGVRKRGVTEHGLLAPSPSLLTWDLIESYEWGGKSGHTLIVIVRLRSRSPRTRKVKLSVPPVHKEVVESLLAQHLPTQSGTGDERRMPDE